MNNAFAIFFIGFLIGFFLLTPLVIKFVENVGIYL